MIFNPLKKLTLALVVTLPIFSITSHAKVMDCETTEKFANYYDEIRCFTDNPRYALVKRNDKQSFNAHYGFIDKEGNVAIPLQYEYAESFSDGLAVVMKDKKYGFVNAKNDVVIPFNYNFARSFQDGIAIVKLPNELESMIDTTGKIILPAEYLEIFYHKGLVYAIGKQEKMGVVDLNNRQIIPFEYDVLAGFQENGLSIAMKNCPKQRIVNHELAKECEFGVIDKHNRAVIPFQHRHISATAGMGLYLIEQQGKIGAIDKQNRIVIPMIYDKLRQINEHTFLAQKGNQYGKFKLDEKGNVIEAFQ